MNDSELLTLITPFIAALRYHCRDSFISYSPRIFAKVVEELQVKENSFAKCFRLYPHSIEVGKSCPDFHRGLSLALTAGLIAWECPDYTRFILRLSLRSTAQILQGVADPEALLIFAKTYITKVELS